MTGSTSWTLFLQENGGEGKSRTQLQREYKKTIEYKKNKCKRSNKILNVKTKRCNKKESTKKKKKKKTTRKKKATRKKKTTRKKKNVSKKSSNELSCNMYNGKAYKYGNCDTENLDYNNINYVEEHNHDIEEDGENVDSDNEEYKPCICGHKKKKDASVLFNYLTKEVNRRADEEGDGD